MMKEIYEMTILMDIDGTIKDLANETTNALKNTLWKLGNIEVGFRGKVVMFINRLNMYLVKTGFLPTNKFMQNILLFFYSILLFVPYKDFKQYYFEEYNKENIFFEINKNEDVVSFFSEGHNKIFLITKNIQNMSMLNEEFPGSKSIKEHIINLIIAKERFTKYYTYKEFINTNKLSRDDVVIIGDNFWDDVLPAILLGVKVVWCNMYDCKTKKIFCKVFKKVFKNIIVFSKNSFKSLI